MNARDYALLQLDQRRLPGWPAGMARPARDAPRPPHDPRDRALAEAVLVGTIKNLLLLQHLIAHYSQRSLKSIDPLTQKILAIGLCQLRFLTRVPPSAAVDEAVEQTRRFGRRKASGFVNAVLRRAAREPDVPLPSPDDDPREHARLALSHPPELFDRYVALLGSPEAALALCRHDNAEPPTIVRLSAGASVEQLAEVAGTGVSITPHERAGMAVVEPAKVALLAEWAARGLAQAQDPTSAAVVPRCDVRPGQAVLDRCCGVGTKTLQLREAVGGAGVVHAIDPNGQRLAALRQLVDARGLANVHVHRAAMLSDPGGAIPAAFDRALVDAPCSNSGVFARRPEARYAQSRQALASVARLQDRILDDTAPRVAPGGLLVYSTCSIWPEENQQRVAAFVGRHPQFVVRSQASTMPQSDGGPAHYRDGGYVAVLERTA